MFYHFFRDEFVSVSSAVDLDSHALIRGCAALGTFVDDYRALLTPPCVTIFFLARLFRPVLV